MKTSIADKAPATGINEEVDSQALQRYRAHRKPFFFVLVSQSHALSLCLWFLQ